MFEYILVPNNNNIENPCKTCVLKYTFHMFDSFLANKAKHGTSYISDLSARLVYIPAQFIRRSVGDITLTLW